STRINIGRRALREGAQLFPGPRHHVANWHRLELPVLHLTTLLGPKLLVVDLSQHVVVADTTLHLHYFSGVLLNRRCSDPTIAELAIVGLYNEGMQVVGS